MDAFEYALQMELDGEKFYREQAALNQDGVLKPVFLSLAADEKKHGEMIKNAQRGIDILVTEEELVKIENVFTDAVGLENSKNDLRQINVYEKALDMEKKSIELYKKLLSESTENHAIYRFLIEQEEEHYSIIEEIIHMVRKPDQWVESAMFGIRKEYY